MQDVAYIDRLGKPRADTNWMDSANCKGADPNVFYPQPPEFTGQEARRRYLADVETAKSYCMFCPVQEACLRDAKARGEVWGVWGGEDFYISKKSQRARMVP